MDDKVLSLTSDDSDEDFIPKGNYLILFHKIKARCYSILLLYNSN